jgi:hypothetical protein
MIAALVLIAIIVQDQTPLRAAPRDTAPQQAVLWQGDTLEVRGERLDYLQVYDHRRERAGYVRTWQVRTYTLDLSGAPELLAVALIQFPSNVRTVGRAGKRSTVQLAMVRTLMTIKPTSAPYRGLSMTLISSGLARRSPAVLVPPR